MKKIKILQGLVSRRKEGSHDGNGWGLNGGFHDGSACLYQDGRVSDGIRVPEFEGSDFNVS